MLSSYSSFVFRLYPNATQEKWLSYVFKAGKIIWNELLEQEVMREENGELPTPSQLLIAQARSYVHKEGFDKGDPSGYAEVGMILGRALENHRKKPDAFGHPKPRRVDSLPYVYATRNYGEKMPYDGDCLELPYLGRMKIRGLRPLPFGAEILAVFIKQHRTGLYYATISFRRRIPPPRLDPTIQAKSIGLDYSPSRLFVTSDPTFQLPQGYIKAHRKSIHLLDHRMGRFKLCKPYSGRAEKRRHIVARSEADITNRRKDIIEKASDMLTKNYGTICIENLDIQGMAKPTKTLKIGRSIRCSSWANFVDRLKQKGMERGNRIVMVGRYFPSSRLCSSCGAEKKISLKERIYRCSNCGLEIDRDVNAAINIEREGLRILSRE